MSSTLSQMQPFGKGEVTWKFSNRVILLKFVTQRVSHDDVKVLLYTT